MPDIRKSRFDRLGVLARQSEVDGFLFTSPPVIKCFTGYYYNFETGPSPFHVLPAALYISSSGKMSLLLADSEYGKAIFVRPDIEVSYYFSYSYEDPLKFEADFLFQLLSIVKGDGRAGTSLGIENNTFPYSLYKLLSEECGWIKLKDTTGGINQLKAVKDEDEIEYIRQAANLADIGQEAVLKYAKAGITELELFSRVRLEMETAAGTRVPMMTDLVSGLASATGGGNPQNTLIKENDLILSDFTPCLNGYWGDSCNTIVVGIPTAEQSSIFLLVKEALAMGIEKIRPGIAAREVDLVMRNHLEAAGGFGHHGGHGVGTVYHEEPRIVPYNTMILEPGMVIALEPAVYKEGYGIRLEHLIVVTETGSQKLTKFEHRFHQ